MSEGGQKCAFWSFCMLFVFVRPARFHLFSKRLTSPKVKHLPGQKHDFASRVVPGWARMQVLSMFLKNMLFHTKNIKSHTRQKAQKHEPAKTCKNMKNEPRRARQRLRRGAGVAKGPPLGPAVTRKSWFSYRRCVTFAESDVFASGGLRGGFSARLPAPAGRL